MEHKLFGTDGIRSRAGITPLDPAVIFQVGRHLVGLGRKRILIGRDTRSSGPWIADVLKEGIESSGGDADLAGVITTPGVAYLVPKGGYDAGIVVSASHNPYQDNGIKIFSADGAKLSDHEETAIETLVRGNTGSSGRHFGELPEEDPELTNFQAGLIQPYVDFLVSVPVENRLKSFEMVVDCANGAAFHIAPQVLDRLGVAGETLNAEPNGRNINLDCGSLFPGTMACRVGEQAAAMGAAFDGDCDRSILADETGRLVDGDDILYILARHLNERGSLQSRGVVLTVMANFGLELALKRLGLHVIRTQVGDRYVREEMLRGNHVLGGEPSGHIIVRTHSEAGDGILTALLVAEIIASEGRPLSELRQGLERYPQTLLNVKVREKREFGSIASIRDQIRAVENVLLGKGRLLVRYSGTEPLVRVMVEGEDRAEIEACAKAIASRFEEELGEDAL